MNDKLQLSDVKKDFSFTINSDMCPIGYMDKYRRDSDSGKSRTLDFDVYLPSIGMNLQRPFVWTLLQKQQLILSIIKENPIPKITIIQHEHEDGGIDFQVIDGKQRLSTILSFLRGEFKIEVKGREYSYDDLGVDAAFNIARYNPRGDVAYSYYDKPISDEDKILWFQQINFSGTPQEENHIVHLLKNINK